VFSFSVSIEIGVILPTSTPDPAQPILGDVRESARFAEEAGLDSVWSTDHVIASAPILDSTVVLATAAAVTGRVKIGFGVMLVTSASVWPAATSCCCIPTAPPTPAPAAPTAIPAPCSARTVWPFARS
jgi:hypothetical protein